MPITITPKEALLRNTREVSTEKADFAASLFFKERQDLIPIDVLIPMHIRELVLIDTGWQYYDRYFSTILDRQQYHFTMVGKTCYVKRRA